MEKVQLGNIFFGEVDGETEANKENFEELFYGEEEYYEDIIEGSKFLIIGRKGTGKTFLANYIKRKVNSKEGYSCVILSANDLQLYELLSLNGNKVDRKQGELLWEYILYSLIADKIIEKHTYLKYIPFSKIKKLKFFLKDYKTNFKLTEISTSNNVEVAVTVNTNGLNNEFGGKNSQKLDLKYKLNEYYEKLKPLKENVYRALKDDKYFIIIDDLDCLNVSTKMDVNYSQHIANLLNVIKKVNNEFIQKKKGSNKIVALLRNDIIDYLNLNDSNINKTISSKFIKLNWISKEKDKEPYEHPLIKMILLKIKKSTKEYNDCSNEDLYNLIFPGNVRDKSIAYYLIDNSFGRPRDIIQFLNIVKDKYRSNYSFNPKYIKECLKDYSKWFYDELSNEISIHENSEMIKHSINLIRDFKKIDFTFDEIERFYRSSKDNYCSITDLKDAFKVLYKLGVVGVSWEAKKNSKQYFVSWGYRDDSDPEINFKKQFTVHGALRKSLSLN